MLIRLVGVKFSGLIYGAYQTDLFADNAEEVNLMQAMDRIKSRYGTAFLMKGICTHARGERRGRCS
jgi:DNA polymerase-4